EAAPVYSAEGAQSTNDNRELPQELRLMLYLTGEQPASYPSRSELFWAFINTALRKCVDENVILDACLDETYAGNSIYDHVRDNGGADQRQATNPARAQ